MFAHQKSCHILTVFLWIRWERLSSIIKDCRNWKLYFQSLLFCVKLTLFNWNILPVISRTRVVRSLFQSMTTVIALRPGSCQNGSSCVQNWKYEFPVIFLCYCEIHSTHIENGLYLHARHIFLFLCFYVEINLFHNEISITFNLFSGRQFCWNFPTEFNL